MVVYDEATVVIQEHRLQIQKEGLRNLTLSRKNVEEFEDMVSNCHMYGMKNQM